MVLDNNQFKNIFEALILTKQMENIKLQKKLHEQYHIMNFTHSFQHYRLMTRYVI
jgi:hypothetical protein